MWPLPETGGGDYGGIYSHCEEIVLRGCLDCFAVRCYVCKAEHRACQVTCSLPRPQNETHDLVQACLNIQTRLVHIR